MHIDFAAFVSSLRFMIEGWLGIFVVMGVIIAVVIGLNDVAGKLEEKAESKQEE